MCEVRSCMEQLLKALTDGDLNENIKDPAVFSQLCDFMHLRLEMQKLATDKSGLPNFKNCKQNLGDILMKLKDNKAWTDYFARDLQTRMIKTEAAYDD